jgi:hypothetical protein
MDRSFIPGQEVRVVSRASAIPAGRRGHRIATGSGDKTVRIWDSEPVAKRWRAQHTDDRLRPEAEHLVEKLFEELGEASEVAQRIRADADLSPDLRRLALQSLLSRAK